MRGGPYFWGGCLHREAGVSVCCPTPSCTATQLIYATGLEARPRRCVEKSPLGLKKPRHAAGKWQQGVRPLRRRLQSREPRYRRAEHSSSSTDPTKLRPESKCWNDKASPASLKHLQQSCHNTMFTDRTNIFEYNQHKKLKYENRNSTIKIN
jgi:hypothetical protein